MVPGFVCGHIGVCYVIEHDTSKCMAERMLTHKVSSQTNKIAVTLLLSVKSLPTCVVC